MNDYNVCKNGVVKITKEINSEYKKTQDKKILKTNCFKSTRIMNEEIRKEVRGRKTFVFWTLICLLIFLAMGNLILTFTILGVLRLGYGMNSLELIPEAFAVKFYGNTDLGHVYKVDGKLNGFADQPIEIKGEKNGSIHLNLVGRNGRPINKLVMDHNGSVFHNTDTFIVRGSSETRASFSSRSPHFNLHTPINKLKVKLVHSNRVRSSSNSSMEIKSDNHINIRGAEGTRMESQRITWSADQNIVLKSVNGSLVLHSLNGVSIDMKNIPISTISKGSTGIMQYKLCVCVPHGKLFRLPVKEGQTKTSCSHVRMTPDFNPCM